MAYNAPLTSIEERVKGVWQAEFQLMLAANRAALIQCFEACVLPAVPQMQPSTPKLKLYEVSDAPSADMNGITDVVGQSLVSLGQRNIFAQAKFAAAIIIIYNYMIQKLAIDLGMNAAAGVRALLIDKSNNLHLTTILQAASNNVRHADEWRRFAATYASAHTKKERQKKQQQDASMVPLAKFLGLSLPITSDVSLRVLQALAQPSNLYADLELKLLNAGLELVLPTFPRARIGATIVQTAVPTNQLIPQQRGFT